MKKEKLNILIVLADQHNADLMGCAGHGQVLTPNLDAFSASGTRFARAYCQNPICTPSRVSILSGQYCHNHGLYGLSGPAPSALPNFMSHFKAAGYRTAAFGKLHLPNNPRNWLTDDLERFGDTYETVDGEHLKSEFFDYLGSLGLRELEDSHHNKWNYGYGSISLDAMPSLLPYEHTQEVWCVKQTIEFIDKSPEKPFCIEVAFQKPHHPLLPNERFWNLYPSDIELPATFFQGPEGRPPHFQSMWHQFRKIKWDYSGDGEGFIDGARRSWRGTLACISQIDDVFGRLMCFLEERGLAENTIVIYSSDHGAYHGIHGIVEKAPGICSDAVCRVPLIWRVPGITQPGMICGELTESVDIFPTIASLCGLAPPDTADGKDITPILSGKKEQIHDLAVTENPWSKAIRWGKWRFVHYRREMFDGDDAGELYDIENDPDERCNLYNEPELSNTVFEGRRLLLDWLIGTTRIVTSHPAVTSGAGMEGKRSYPVAADGKAPDYVQVHNRKDNLINYL